MCVCGVFPFILDVRLVDVLARVTQRKVKQDFSFTFLLRCLPSIFCQEGFNGSFPSSTVKSNFVYNNEIITVLHLLGHFILFFYFL